MSPKKDSPLFYSVLLLMYNWPIIRDVALFVAGLGGVAHETIVATAERPTLLILFAAMMGLPAFLRQDQGSGNDKKNG